MVWALRRAWVAVLVHGLTRVLGVRGGRESG